MIAAAKLNNAPILAASWTAPGSKATEATNKETVNPIPATIPKTKISAYMNLLSQKLQQKNLQINQQTIIKKLYK